MIFAVGEHGALERVQHRDGRRLRVLSHASLLCEAATPRPRHDSTAAAAFLAQRVGKVWSCCLLSGVCLCCRDDKPSAVVICTEDEQHLHSLSRSLHDKVDDRQQAHPVLLSTTLCQRIPPVLRRPEAASNHSLATVAPSGGAGENGAATPVTATTTTHYTIITIITATTNANATLMP